VRGGNCGREKKKTKAVCLSKFKKKIRRPREPGRTRGQEKPKTIDWYNNSASPLKKQEKNQG
jgi:hypothetical protein